MDAAARLTPPDASLRALLRLAWPLFIANLAVVGNGTIDAIMAGRLSPNDMAGVAVASSIYITVYIGFMAVLQALSPIAGHHYGAQRWRAIGDDLPHPDNRITLSASEKDEDGIPVASLFYEPRDNDKKMMRYMLYESEQGNTRLSGALA